MSAGDGAADELAAIASELYALRPDAFAATRDERVRTARAAKRQPLARDLARLRRPTQSAWLVNLLWRERRDALSELLELGGQLSQAQAAASGPTLLRLTARRRELEAALVRDARALGEQAGVSVTASMEREVQETLAAALAVPEVAQEIRTGRLVKPAAYAGFGFGGGSVLPFPSPAPPPPAKPPPAAAAPVEAEPRPEAVQAGEARAERQEQPHGAASVRQKADHGAEAAHQKAEQRAEAARVAAERLAALERAVHDTQAAVERAAAVLAERTRAADATERQFTSLRTRTEQLRVQLEALEAQAATAGRAATTAASSKVQAETTHTRAVEAHDAAVQAHTAAAEAD